MATPNTVPFLSPGERRCARVERGHPGRRQGPWKYEDARLPHRKSEQVLRPESHLVATI